MAKPVWFVVINQSGTPEITIYHVSYSPLGAQALKEATEKLIGDNKNPTEYEMVALNFEDEQLAAVDLYGYLRRIGMPEADQRPFVEKFKKKMVELLNLDESQMQN